MDTARWDDCPGVKSDGKVGHMMRDGCWSCAPYWERVPYCPHCGARIRKVSRTGRVKCEGCKAFVLVVREAGS
mgnify:CR=1 FL=1